MTTQLGRTRPLRGDPPEHADRRPGKLDDPSAEEQAALDALADYRQWDSGYASSRRPGRRQLGYGLIDSPAGTGLDRREVPGLDRLRRPPRERVQPRRAPRQRDDVLGDWLRRILGPAVLGELQGKGRERPVDLPTGVAVSPRSSAEIAAAMVEPRFNIMHWREMPRAATSPLSSSRRCSSRTSAGSSRPSAKSSARARPARHRGAQYRRGNFQRPPAQIAAFGRQLHLSGALVGRAARPGDQALRLQTFEHRRKGGRIQLQRRGDVLDRQRLPARLSRCPTVRASPDIADGSARAASSNGRYTASTARLVTASAKHTWRSSDSGSMSAATPSLIARSYTLD